MNATEMFNISKEIDSTLLSFEFCDNLSEEVISIIDKLIENSAKQGNTSLELVYNRIIGKYIDKFSGDKIVEELGVLSCDQALILNNDIKFHYELYGFRVIKFNEFRDFNIEIRWGYPLVKLPDPKRLRKYLGYN